MGQFDVSVEEALVAFVVMLASHGVGALGVAIKNRWIGMAASLVLIASVSVMPLVWALPSLFLCVVWRPPFEVFAMWNVVYYFMGFCVAMCLFMSQPPTIDPTSDGERSARSIIYVAMPETSVFSVLGSVAGFCVSFGTVAMIHKHYEVWTANIARMTASVFLLSSLHRLVGASVQGFRSLVDTVAFVLLAVCGVGLIVVARRYQRGEGRQPVFQGPGVAVAATTGVLIAFIMDGVVLFLEAYQMIFTVCAWVFCAAMFALYINRYDPVDLSRPNVLRYVFHHWLVQF